MAVQKLNPPEGPAPLGPYSQLAVVPADHRLLVLAGQVGVGADGAIPDSLEAQFELALGHALRIAASQGAGPDDVVRLTYYLTERPADLTRFRAIVARAFAGPPPASTLLIVAGLAAPQLKVEVDLVAAVKPEPVAR